MASTESLPDHLIELDRDCARLEELLRRGFDADVDLYPIDEPRVHFAIATTLEGAQRLDQELPALLRLMALAIEGRA